MLTLNIRDTRQRYSEVNKKALSGLEVTTIMGGHETSAVSHVNKLYFDYLLDKTVVFAPYAVEDEELGGFTVVCDTVGLYGEGESLEAAIDNLAAVTVEYIDMYAADPQLYSRFNSVEKNVALLKLLRCSDKAEIRRVMNLNASSIYTKRHQEAT